MKAWKLLVGVACAAGAFAALKIAPLAVAYLGGNYIGETIFAGQPTLTFAGQVAAAEKAGLKMYKALKEELPAEYENAAAAYLTYAKAGRSETDADAYVGKIMADIRRRHAESFRKADPALALHALEAKKDLLSQVMAEVPAQDCTRWALSGELTPSMRKDKMLAPLDRFGEAAFRVMGAAQRSPVDIGAATEEDWTVLQLQYVAAGGTLAELQLIGQPDTTSPDVCRAALRFYQVLSDMPGEAGQRVRAEVLQAGAQ